MRYDKTTGEVLATKDELFLGHSQQAVQFRSDAQVPIAPREVQPLLEHLARGVAAFAIGSELHAEERSILETYLAALETGAQALREYVDHTHPKEVSNPRITPSVR